MSLITRLNNALKNEPDEYLTALLVVASLVLLIAAFRAPPLLKAGILAWVIAP